MADPRGRPDRRLILRVREDHPEFAEATALSHPELVEGPAATGGAFDLTPA